MKRVYFSAVLSICSILLCPKVNYAALITRTYTYTAGNTITANENNTNENTIYTEINGNLNNANIAAGGILNANIADTTIDVAKFTSSVQSTFTAVGYLSAYSRPHLVFASTSLVDISTNTDTLNKTCVLFHDGTQRCVTENVISANKYRRFDITTTCNFVSGTEDSGLDGAVAAANTWYDLYAVKSQIDTTKFVVCGTTNTPVQQNASNLNSMFGTNAWVSLGLIRYGATESPTTSILAFTQSGNTTTFDNAVTEHAISIVGMRLADTASGTSANWAYASGSAGAVLPLNITTAFAGTLFIPGTAGTLSMSTGASGFLWRSDVNNAIVETNITPSVPFNALSGLTTAAPAGSTITTTLRGFIDDSLNTGSNPQY